MQSAWQIRTWQHCSRPWLPGPCPRLSTCTGDFASPEGCITGWRQIFMHFTSPIRRYADIVVHRLLLKSLRPENEVGQLERS